MWKDAGKQEDVGCGGALEHRAGAPEREGEREHQRVGEGSTGVKPKCQRGRKRGKLEHQARAPDGKVREKYIYIVARGHYCTKALICVCNSEKSGNI